MLCLSCSTGASLLVFFLIHIVYNVHKTDQVMLVSLTSFWVSMFILSQAEMTAGCWGALGWIWCVVRETNAARDWTLNESLHVLKAETKPNIKVCIQVVLAMYPIGHILHQPCGCRFSFQPSSSTPDLIHLINWSQSSESSLVGTKTCSHTALCGIVWTRLSYTII